MNLPQGKMTGQELEDLGYCTVGCDITHEKPFVARIGKDTHNIGAVYEGIPGKPNKCLAFQNHNHFGRVALISDVMKIIKEENGRRI